MSSLAVLLGSATRANIIRALAQSGEPLGPYRVAKMFGMNVAKTYSEMKRLAALGVVEGVRGGRGTAYTLVDEDLRRLSLRLSQRVVPLERWKSPPSKASRFMMGMQAVPGFGLEGGEEATWAKASRQEGELDGLAEMGRKRFDAKYRRVGERAFARL